MLEISTEPSVFPKLEQLMQDKALFRSFLLVLLYHDMLFENPLVQEKMFLFVEDYKTIADSLDREDESNHGNILSSICIREQDIDDFFLELWDNGVYGKLFFSGEDVKKSFMEIIHASQRSSVGLCGDSFAYFLREKFIWAKNGMSIEDWKVISKNLYNSSASVDAIKERLWYLAKSKREAFMKDLKEKGFSFAWINGDEWSEKVSGILH